MEFGKSVCWGFGNVTGLRDEMDSLNALSPFPRRSPQLRHL